MVTGGSQISFTANEPPTQKVVKQYGLQRSGTNYTRFLLVTHYYVDVWVDRGGWKHGYYRDVQHKVDVLVTVKNPYDWLISLYNYSNYPLGLPKFIRSKYSFEGMQAENPITHWNTMNRHWYELEIPEHKKLTVRHNDLVKYPEDTIADIAKQLDLIRNDTAFYIPEQAIEPNSLENPNKPFDKSYYLKKGYIEVLSSSDIDFINNQLDEDLMSKLGYKMERV